MIKDGTWMVPTLKKYSHFPINLSPKDYLMLMFVNNKNLLSFLGKQFQEFFCPKTYFLWEICDTKVWNMIAMQIRSWFTCPLIHINVTSFSVFYTRVTVSIGLKKCIQSDSIQSIKLDVHAVKQSALDLSFNQERSWIPDRSKTLIPHLMGNGLRYASGPIRATHPLH